MRVAAPDSHWPLAALVVAVLDLLLWFPASARLGVYPALASMKMPFATFAWVLLGAALACARPETAGDATLWGACVGAVVYGVFNATEATIRDDWRRVSTVTCDVLWGITVCAAASAGSYAVAAMSARATLVAMLASLALVVLACVLVVRERARGGAAEGRGGTPVRRREP